MTSQTSPKGIGPTGLMAITLIAFLIAFSPARAAAAADPEPAAAAPEENAALAYWQAFAAVPAGDAQAATIEAGDKAIFNDPTLKLIDESAYALDELRRGARMSRCDWGMDYNRGPELRMPHLAKGRQLARLALLRARHRFEYGRPRDGVVDALAAMKLGHDLGSDPVMIAVLVEYAVELISTDLLARHLPRLSPEELDQLAETLDKLPTGDRLRDVWRTESRYMVDWFEQRLTQAAAEGEDGGGAGESWEARVLAMPVFGEDERKMLKAAGVPSLERMREQLEAIRAYYRQIEPLTDLPPAEQDAKVAALGDVRKDNVLAQILLPAVARALHIHNLAKVRAALLRAAIATQRGGPDRLKEPAHADPLGKGPFEYHKTDDGFELRSQLKDEHGKPVTLTVGAGQAQ